MSLKQGKVIKTISNTFYVEIDDKIKLCHASKKLNLNKNKIVAGDNVEVDYDNLYIKSVLPRTNKLIRPSIANIDLAILVFSASEPEMNFGLLDRMILIMEINKLEVAILITKIDLLSETELVELKLKMQYYEKIGYQILYNGLKDSFTIDEVKTKGSNLMFAGQTGVGKSTIINKIIPNLNLKTQEISKSLNRGKHTTREATFYKLGNKYIIDTPGFSSFDIPLTKEDIRENYRDFKVLSEECKFNNCYHHKEPKCKVKTELDAGKILESRYESYLKLLEGSE